MEQSADLDGALLSVSCEYGIPCVGWMGSTTMVTMDCMRAQSQDLWARHAGQLETLGRAKFNSWLIESGTIDEEVHIVGSTPLVYGM